jgi:hypothetical protein
MKAVKSPMEGNMLRLPLQVAPVERAVVPSALVGGTGVEASQNWGQIIGQALPVVTSILGGLF